MGPDTGCCFSAPQITFSFLKYLFLIHLVCSACTESRIHYCWTDCWRLSKQPTTHLSVPRTCVILMISSLGLLVICSCMLIWLFLFCGFFKSFFLGNVLISNTMTSLSNLFLCLIFQLTVFLWDCLLSFILSFWLRILYRSVILDFVLCLVPPVPLASCVLLVSTLNFPNVDQRPDFFVALTSRLQKRSCDM